MDVMDFSEYREIALTGYLLRYEGSIAWTAYIVGTIYGIIYIRSKEDIDIVVNSLVIFSVPILVIGLLDILGIFALTLPLIEDVIWLGNVEAKLHATMPSRFTSTLFNPNYYGTYAALVLPIIISYPSKLKS